MKTSVNRRAAAILTTAALTVGGVMSAGVGSAAAAAPSSASFSSGPMLPDGSRTIFVYAEGKYAGKAVWTANGDKLQAFDTVADGFGIAAYISTSSGVREASTYGHSSPYTATKTGNIAEGTSLGFWACVGGAAGQRCSEVVSAKA
ncbi:hypothetical protein [Streptomyces sp. NPDC015131]|uniref:hypothetical protein n=1 Tax=Streptomyces sp. NPDC015131 TaxID=3364941 RepID=UPI0037004365